MSHYPPPLQHKRAPKPSDISKEYPKYSNGDLHTQRLPDKMIATDRAPSPTQINPRNNYINQIYYIVKTCSPDYLATVMDDHTNETEHEHGLDEITCHMYTPATCGNHWLEGVDHDGIFIAPQAHCHHKMYRAPALRTGHHVLNHVCSERLSLSTSDATSYKPARNWFIS